MQDTQKPEGRPRTGVRHGTAGSAQPLQSAEENLLSTLVKETKQWQSSATASSAKQTKRYERGKITAEPLLKDTSLIRTVSDVPIVCFCVQINL